MKRLESWLEEIGARLLWSVSLGEGKIKKYIARGGMAFTVEIFPEEKGFEIYTPADTNGVSATFEDAEKRLGL